MYVFMWILITLFRLHVISSHTDRYIDRLGTDYMESKKSELHKIPKMYSYIITKKKKYIIHIMAVAKSFIILLTLPNSFLSAKTTLT